MPVCWSYSGVVGVMGGANPGDGGAGANPGEGGARAYGDGERGKDRDGDGERRDTDVAEVDAEMELAREDAVAELARDEVVVLAARPPMLRTAGTGTGARSPPSTGWRDCRRSGRILGMCETVAVDADGSPGWGVLCIDSGVGTVVGVVVACGFGSADVVTPVAARGRSPLGMLDMVLGLRRRLGVRGRGFSLSAIMTRRTRLRLRMSGRLVVLVTVWVVCAESSVRMDGVRVMCGPSEVWLCTRDSRAVGSLRRIQLVGGGPPFHAPNSSASASTSSHSLWVRRAREVDREYAEERVYAEERKLEARLRLGWDPERWRLSDEMRRVRALGASSSSESLQPRPVVRPMPPRRVLPSRWRTRRMGVSRVSRGRASVPEKTLDAGEGSAKEAEAAAISGNSFERGERKPWWSISCLMGN